MDADPAVVSCIYCTNDRDLERRGKEWWCPVCARCWLALNLKDKTVLRVNKIKPEE